MGGVGKRHFALVVMAKARSAYATCIVASARVESDKKLAAASARNQRMAALSKISARR